jgi:hypothetical protein
VLSEDAGTTATCAAIPLRVTPKTFCPLGVTVKAIAVEAAVLATPMVPT